MLNTVQVEVYGAGFKKDGVNIAGHPKMVSFDGFCVYFHGMGEKEAARHLDGITLLNGRTGWLAYILQEAFYEERAGDEFYGEIFDGLASGAIKGPPDLSGESVLRWVEEVAPEVEKIREGIGRRK